MKGERGSSHAPQDRTELGCLVRQVDQRFVVMTPSLTFRRIIALDDRMAGRVEVARLVARPHMIPLADRCEDAHHAPIFRHSSHPRALGVTPLTRAVDGDTGPPESHDGKGRTISSACEYDV